MIRRHDGATIAISDTAAPIRSSNGKVQWRTVGSSTNIIEASWQALVDSINYKMYKNEKKNGEC